MMQGTLALPLLAAMLRLHKHLQRSEPASGERPAITCFSADLSLVLTALSGAWYAAWQDLMMPASCCSATVSSAQL